MVVDASAMLAFLQGELGAQQVEDHLVDARIGAANWSEVAQKVMQSQGDWATVDALLRSYGLGIEPVTDADAVAAARLWRAGSGLSLADRLCLALAERLNAQVLTADKAWGSGDRIIQIR